MSTSRRSGFTVIELVVVVALVALMSALAVPAMQRWMQYQNLRSTGRTVEAALSHARGEAIRSGNVHIVFFQADHLGNPLLDDQGNIVPILVLDDGRPGPLQNCVVDGGETTRAYTLDPGVAFGTAQAAGPVPSDNGTGPFASGITFSDGAGGAATWILFRPEGTPVPFDAACATGAIGNGGGAVYLTGGGRDLGVVLTPLGGSRAHAWDTTANGWSN